jgi:hypothetical protein
MRNQWEYRREAALKKIVRIHQETTAVVEAVKSEAHMERQSI